MLKVIKLTNTEVFIGDESGKFKNYSRSILTFTPSIGDGVIIQDIDGKEMLVRVNFEASTAAPNIDIYSIYPNSSDYIFFALFITLIILADLYVIVINCF